jgi:hypothetical protein
MLRITQTIELSLRKNDSRLSRDFLKGLALALSLHLLLLLVFRIVSLPNLDTIHPLPPIAVEIDLGADEVVVLPVVAANQLFLEPLESPRSFDNFHGILPLQLKQEPFCAHKIVIDIPDFSEIEKIDYFPLPNTQEEDDPRR